MSNSDYKPYFEGWYFKHQQNSQGITFIPSISIDSHGIRRAHIQVITECDSYQFHFPYSEFCRGKRFGLRIGKNIFTDRGILVDMQNEAVSIHGRYEYGKLTRPSSAIMGPFAVIPKMECSHRIISLKHAVNGIMTVNEREYRMENGNGYLEGDSGRSFPKRFLWTQCNDFPDKETAVMAAVADIPLSGVTFRGCICSVYYHGIEHRLATYNGGKTLDCCSSGFLLKRGPYKLEMKLGQGEDQKLMAPSNGSMNRVINEKAFCTARYRFYADNTLLFDQECNGASYEYAVRK